MPLYVDLGNYAPARYRQHRVQGPPSKSLNASKRQV